MVTQGISVDVIGTERRTHVMLDLDHIYNRDLRLQQSVGNNNRILRAGVLHIVFAALHKIGKQLTEVTSTYVYEDVQNDRNRVHFTCSEHI